jgi:hypothetical protein
VLCLRNLAFGRVLKYSAAPARSFVPAMEARALKQRRLSIGAECEVMLNFSLTNARLCWTDVDNEASGHVMVHCHDATL